MAVNVEFLDHPCVAGSWWAPGAAKGRPRWPPWWPPWRPSTGPPLAATRPDDVAALAGLATAATPAAILPGLDLVTAGETAPGAAVAAVEGGASVDLDGRPRGR